MSKATDEEENLALAAIFLVGTGVTVVVCLGVWWMFYWGAPVDRGNDGGLYLILSTFTGIGLGIIVGLSSGVLTLFGLNQWNRRKKAGS